MIYYIIKKNYKYRKNFCLNECDFVRLYNLKLLSKLYNHRKLHFYCNYKLNFLGNLKKCSITKIRNFCVMTGRSRSVIKDFKVTRMQLKILLNTGSLSGLSKSSHF